MRRGHLFKICDYSNTIDHYRNVVFSAINLITKSKTATIIPNGENPFDRTWHDGLLFRKWL